MGIIDRHQAEKLAWEGYVGSQTPEEFLEISREQGHATVEAAVSAYVSTLDVEQNLFDDPIWTADDLPSLLAGYIERVTEAGIQGAGVQEESHHVNRITL